MQCKKCNALIPEGYMYCPECGDEVIIVSDFDIKLEDNIDLSTLAKTNELPENKKELNKQLLDAKTIDLQDVNSGVKSQATADDISANSDKAADTIVINTDDSVKLPLPLVIVITISSLILILAIVFGIIQLVRYNSFDYQYGKAFEYASNNDFDKAIKHLKRANILEDNEDARILLADCYIAKNNYDAAIAVLFDATQIYKDDVAIYDLIVECYEKQGDSRGIHELIENNDDPTLALRYSDYVSIAPSFSLEGGTYITPDPIKLTVPGNGSIYYTTDGSTPTEDSLSYIGAIPLEFGTTVISAININEKGIVSEVVSNTYVVEQEVVDKPKLILPSGSLSKPELIGVMVPEGCKVYYTKDGSEPTSESREYTTSMLMPLGKSEFRFIAYNSAGIASDVIIGEYNLVINDNIDTPTAEYAIKYQLTGLGEIVDENAYKSKYGYAADGRCYYIIEEYDPEDKKTGRNFAVDTSSGELFTFDRSTFKTNPL